MSVRSGKWKTAVLPWKRQGAADFSKRVAFGQAGVKNRSRDACLAQPIPFSAHMKKAVGPAPCLEECRTTFGRWLSRTHGSGEHGGYLGVAGSCGRVHEEFCDLTLLPSSDFRFGLELPASSLERNRPVFGLLRTCFSNASRKTESFSLHKSPGVAPASAISQNRLKSSRDESSTDEGDRLMVCVLCAGSGGATGVGCFKSVAKTQKLSPSIWRVPRSEFHAQQRSFPAAVLFFPMRTVLFFPLRSGGCCVSCGGGSLAPKSVLRGTPRSFLVPTFHLPAT